MRTREQAVLAIEALLVHPDEPGYADLVAIAERGWPVWRIAEHLGMTQNVIKSYQHPDFRNV